MGETECFFGHNIARGGGEDDGMNPKPNKKLSLGAESYGTIAWKGFFTQSQVLLSSIVAWERVSNLLTMRWTVLPPTQTAINPNVRPLGTFKTEMAAQNGKRSVSTILWKK